MECRKQVQEKTAEQTVKRQLEISPNSSQGAEYSDKEGDTKLEKIDDETAKKQVNQTGKKEKIDRKV